MTVTTKFFPFVKGFDQTTDDRLLEPGTPRSIENLVIEKRGRLRMRYDYDSLPMTVQASASALSLFDLATYNGRLLGFGEVAGFYSPLACSEVLEFVNSPLFAWRASGVVQLRLPRIPYGAHLRQIGGVNERNASITRSDIAAGGGLVCMVWHDSDQAETAVHIVRASDDATVLYEDITSLTLPRVVCVGTKFFISGVNGTTPKLFRFDPAVDTALTALPDPAAAGGAIGCFDMSLSHEGDTFWIAYFRTGPTTRVHGFDASGTETHDFAGPAVVCNAITVLTETSLGGVGRINVACVINGTNAVNMSTYLVATSALQTNTPAMFANALGQVGMCVNGIQTARNITVAFQDGSDIRLGAFLSSTHGSVVSASRYFNLKMASKQFCVLSRPVYAAITTEGSDGSGTHLLVNNYHSNVGIENVSAVANRLLAMPPDVFELPNIALDVSTGLLYWAHLTKTQSALAAPRAFELTFAGTHRRQTAELGDCLYIAGGFVSVFDGHALAEANYIERPLIVSVAFQTTAGAMDLLGVYQFVAVFESQDAQGNRIQSPPSDVFTVTLTGVNNQVGLNITGSHTMRGGFSIPDNPGPTDKLSHMVLYRTKNTSGGNLTFYRDVSQVVLGNGQTFSMTSAQSDTSLEANEILYTQRERGSLSGPLPFEMSEPCSSLASSADRILSGGLPKSTNIQESRPLFPSEQCNWSEGIGFQRATRGAVLAVARLDERRIVFTARELFELDGPGVDDNGVGDIGAPRRLPSEVGLYGGQLGWRSVVECSLGLMFQGLQDQIYLLPRGGNTPQRIGLAVQDKLAAFPDISAAIYCADDRTVRFTCNNLAGSDSIALIYDLVHEAWVTEGPYGAATAAAVLYQTRAAVLQSNVVKQQRTSHPPAAFISNAWRSGLIHPADPGGFLHALNSQFFGEYRGDCALRCIFKFDDLTTETVTAEVNAVALTANNQANANSDFLANAYTLQTVNTVGAPYSFKFHPNQIKCESLKVDFEVDVPFPNVIATAGFSDPTLVTSLNVTLSANRQIGDRMIVALTTGNLTPGAASAAGWNVIFSSGNPVRFTVLERVLDGTEVSPVTFSWTTGNSACAVAWTIRNAHPSAPSETAAAASVSPVTSLGSNVLTPSWGLQNTLWLSLVGIADKTLAGVNLTNAPDGLRRGISRSNTSSTPSLSGQLIGADRAQRIASFAPISWSWAEASPATTLVIGVRPNPNLASEGLAYHYWTLDVEGTGKSALKQPLQMG